MDGLSDADIAAAAEAAKERKLAGKWVLPLQNTTQQPWQEWLRRRDVRKRLFDVATHRADRGDANDTRAIVQRLADCAPNAPRCSATRRRPTYVLDDQMAKTPAAAIKLLTDIGAPAIAKARSEARRIQSSHRPRARRD